MTSTGPIRWMPSDQVMNSKCPVCGTSGDQPHVLDMSVATSPEGPLHLLRCTGCGSGYVHEFRYPDYQNYEITKEAVRFYVEQGAGMDILSRPATLAHKTGARNYLEIGCGFGFGVDFAARTFDMNARGIDPAPQAKAGRDALGIDIVPDYLTSESASVFGLQDMIVAMEVIEHIVEPQPFLKMIKDNLTPQGIVVMSTPNVAALAERESQMLLPVLSPGFHAILFSAEALKNEFLKAGFGYAAVRDEPTSLLVVATVDGREISPDLEIDGEAFATYTGDRMATVSGDDSLWSGFAYRHFKALVNFGFYDRAREALGGLRKEYLARFDIDIGNPALFAARYHIETERMRKGEKVSDWRANAPFHICNLFYFIGVLKMNTIGEEAAFDYFWAAVRVAEGQMAYYKAGGYGDGETEVLACYSSLYLARCALSRAGEVGDASSL
ncbi:hypothetical protein CSC94_18495 [Zhengella mangrovi]|uniref:Methyltransferase type 12 n=1 Tax=Zhengella mangrovi TaxID=1982044 RepID=A0A2G1QJ84_9HYPH|nr:methyltransferase domain-containing protein [Zhengella mangrovi]PHP65583.1 hypothetical protein CSC94_18495 [Zhengella mangrovi]